jgi:hypothetical protein
MSNSLTIVLSGLLYQAPSLLAGLLGIIFAAINWHRAPRASMWAMLGFVLMMVVGLASPIAQQIFFVNRASSPNFIIWLRLASLSFSLLSGASHVMLLVAIYVGRNDPQPRGFAVLPPPMPGSGMG